MNCFYLESKSKIKQNLFSGWDGGWGVGWCKIIFFFFFGGGGVA